MILLTLITNTVTLNYSDCTYLLWKCQYPPFKNCEAMSKKENVNNVYSYIFSLTALSTTFTKH